MHRSIGVGIIGAGGIAAKMHLPELRRNADKFATKVVAGQRESRLRVLQEKFGVPHYTTDYEQVIGDDAVDAVIIATPHPQHVEWGIKALEAGKHVMMQKPLSCDIAEANAFVAAVERSDRTVMVLPHFTDTIFTIRGLVSEGALGRISGARARTSHGGPEVYYREVRAIFGEEGNDLWFFDSKRAGVGALFDMGVYAVSQLVALLGSVKRVTAVVATLDKPTDLEDTATLILQMQSGALATAETSWCDPARTWELSVHGTAAKVVAPGSDGNPATMFVPTALDSDHAGIEQRTLGASEIPGDAHAHFHACICAGRQPPLSHAHAARHVTEVLLAGLESGRTNQPVDVFSSSEQQPST